MAAGAPAGGPRLVGAGYAVPANVRTNDDPIFDWLKTHHPGGEQLFTGYVDRRVLAPGENLDTIMVPAALRALASAGVAPGDVDLLLGTGSVSPLETPNELCRLHAAIGLPKRAWVLPLANDFSNYNAGLYAADALIRAGRARNALVVCAGNWTRYVDYHTPQSVSAADGAGAAVVSASAARGGFVLVDSETSTDASYFGTMYMRGDAVRVPERDEALFTRPTFHITAAGQAGFEAFGEHEPPRVVTQLLQRNGVAPRDVALISHQASQVLLELWQQAIEPGQYLQTLTQFANMTVANVAVNVGYFWDQVDRDWLVLLGIGTEMHTNALLLRRAPPG